MPYTGEMLSYTSIDIIFNPHSTGPSQHLAEDLKRQLAQKYPKIPIKLHATKYAGHAEKLAYTCAKLSKTPLIISSSGDGGYNEVINGAMRAQLKGARPVCAVLAAGNANDHSRTLQDNPLYTAIVAGHERTLDLLKATYTRADKIQSWYAHSYIGLGLTPVVAVELNKTSLNALKELWIVIKTFYKYRPFKIKVADKVHKLDSILFANIGQMAKVLTIAKNARPADGMFEVITFPHVHKFKLLRQLAKATVAGLKPSNQSKDYAFTVLKRMPAQFDGEVKFISKNTDVRITSEHNMLRTIL